ncbi:hypothetical protein IFR05_008999 [Cadophora sp. M221]|nr:hypothetical protein IFR05_008999 [Cadophora sp. M221]
MSFDYSFSFGAGPATPPDFSFEEALNSASFHIGHSRSSSHASMYSQGSSPESVNTQLTTPARSPIRQHGPLLLPKIRPQDQEIHSPPKRMKKMPMTKSNTLQPTTSFRPSHTRSYTNPESISFTPQDNFPSHTRSMSTLCSPIAFAPDNNERRASSADLLDTQTIGKYGFPTYRQMPTYIPSATNSQTETFNQQTFYVPQRTPSPLQNSICLDEMTLSPIDDGNNTSLMAYLTSPNPAPALVRQINIHIRDTNTKHFWWDIRQIRPWTSFNTTTISAIPGLQALLNINLPSSTFPAPPKTSLQPETELDLQNIYSSFYGSKLNAALSLSLGQRHLVMRPSAKSTTDPSFISNYTDDTSQLIYGRGLGRVVGLVKSFDRWNTGMRVEGNHRKVEYLRGLAHLHRHMREHGCRYGFIITEIELVVVRNGGDSVPHFGYLEIQTIQLAAHDNPHTSTFEEVEGSFVDAGEENVVPRKMKMTALLALWYLHMLARDDTLPGQVGWKSEIGAPAEGTRRKCLPKDEWIPEPQLAEKREAKRIRGWVWPEEAVGRKELGKRGVRYNC